MLAEEERKKKQKLVDVFSGNTVVLWLQGCMAWWLVMACDTSAPFQLLQEHWDCHGSKSTSYGIRRPILWRRDVQCYLSIDCPCQWNDTICKITENTNWEYTMLAKLIIQRCIHGEWKIFLKKSLKYQRSCECVQEFQCTCEHIKIFMLSRELLHMSHGDDVSI